MSSVPCIRHRGKAFDKRCWVFKILSSVKNEDLEAKLNAHGEQNGHQKGGVEQAFVGYLVCQVFARLGPRPENRQRQHNKQVDVKHFIVAEVCAQLIQQGNREELDHRLQFNEFERLEAHRQRASAFFE